MDFQSGWINKCYQLNCNMILHHLGPGSPESQERPVLGKVPEPRNYCHWALKGIGSQERQSSKGDCLVCWLLRFSSTEHHLDRREKLCFALDSRTILLQTFLNWGHRITRDKIAVQIDFSVQAEGTTFNHISVKAFLWEAEIKGHIAFKWTNSLEE